MALAWPGGGLNVVVGAFEVDLFEVHVLGDRGKLVFDLEHSGRTTFGTDLQAGHDRFVEVPGILGLI